MYFQCGREFGLDKHVLQCHPLRERELTLHREAPRGRQVESFLASWYVRMKRENTEKAPNMAVVIARTVRMSQYHIFTTDWG